MKLQGLPPPPGLKVFPPSADDALIGHTVIVGQRLVAELPEKAPAYWRARRTFVRNRLAQLGWTEKAIDAELKAFEDAVRSEAQRQRAAAPPDGSNQPNDEAAA